MCEPVSATAAYTGSTSMMTTLAASSAASAAASASIFSAANIMRGLSVASGVMAFAGGQQQAQSVSDSQEEGLKAFYEQTARKQIEINEQAEVNTLERRKQGMIDRAEAVTAAGESGALGFTSDRLIADSFFQQGTDVSTIEMNRKNQIIQTMNENESARANAQGRTNTAYASAPGLIETGLQIGTDIYGTEAAIERNTKAAVGSRYSNYNTASV